MTKKVRIDTNSDILEIISELALCGNTGKNAILQSESCKKLASFLSVTYEQSDACPFCGMAPSVAYDGDVIVYGCKNEECACFDMPMVSEAAWKYRPIESHLRISAELYKTERKQKDM